MTKNIVHVVGARPNFVKAAPVINALKKEIKGVKQIVIHTGQHYDANLSDIFFNALKIPKPDINLKVASSRMQGKQVADVIIGIEKYLAGKKVDLVVVYGDVNSTLGAAIAATKMGIPVAHIEAGLRSFDRTMPEETNRIIVDRISDFHFVTEQSAVRNLLNEGVEKNSIFFVGNTMIDSLYNVLPLIEDTDVDEDYILVTLHRPSNVDNLEGLKKILEICNSINTKMIFPIHPRTRNSFANFGLLNDLNSIKNLEVIEPVGYFEFSGLMKNSMAVLTDSGGIQEETTALGIPCLTLRKNTERPSTIEEGSNRLVDSKNEVLSSLNAIKAKGVRSFEKPELWDGKSGKRISRIIKEII
jgi:UDP-N-acetylglucosamine 2-epimerase (non-hydrolysing)